MVQIIVARFGRDYQIYDDGRGVGFVVVAQDDTNVEIACSAAMIDDLIVGLQDARREAARLRAEKGVKQQTIVSVAPTEPSNLADVGILLSKDFKEAILRFEFSCGREEKIRLPTKKLKELVYNIAEQLDQLPEA